MRPLALALLAALVVAPAAGATTGSARPTLPDIEDEVMCPVCGTALALSESPLAQRERALIQRLIDQGRTKEQIKARLVAEFGPAVLATPQRSGFQLAAYLVPLGAALLAVGGAVLVLLRRRRGPGTAPAPPEGDDFESLVDADLAGLRR